MKNGKEYKYILQDLDGTLTDSMEEITKSIRYASELASAGADRIVTSVEELSRVLL